MGVLLFSHWVVSSSLWPHGPAARQAPLSSTVSGSWLESMSMGLMVPSNRLTLCPPPSPKNSMKRSRTRAGKVFCLSLLPSVTLPLSRSLTSASGITTSRISAGGWIWRNLWRSSWISTRWNLPSILEWCFMCLQSHSCSRRSPGKEEGAVCFQGIQWDWKVRLRLEESGGKTDLCPLTTRF